MQFHFLLFLSEKKPSTRNRPQAKDSMTLIIVLMVSFGCAFVCLLAMTMKIWNLYKRGKFKKEMIVNNRDGHMSESHNSNSNEQLHIEPKVSVVTFSRPRMISTSSSTTPVLYNDVFWQNGARQKEFEGMLLSLGLID